MISDRAIIDPSAKIADDVEIGPFSIIGPNVEINAGTWIGPHVVINGPCKIGKNNKIFQFVSFDYCQDKKYQGEDTELIIGDRNVFREGCTVHRGTSQGIGQTIIGDDNLLMVNTHVAHDCVIGNHVVFSNGASIAGHVIVNDYATLGGIVGVHQFVEIGAHCFVGGGSIVYKDVMPYILVTGYPAEPHGLNVVGLERRNFSKETIQNIRKAYKIIFKNSHTTQEAIETLQPMAKDCPDIQKMIDFMQSSKRGIVR